MFPPVQRPYPPLWFGGSSDAAIEIAAKHVDTYLSWGEPPEQLAEKIEKVRRARRGPGPHDAVRTAHPPDRAGNRGRGLGGGRTDDQPRVGRSRRHSPEAVLDRVAIGRTASGWLRSMAGIATSWWSAPNLWAGLGLVRGGAGTALVGNPQNVAARLREYQSLGVETVIASAYPHLEELFNVAELLFPELGLGQEHKSPSRNRLWQEAGSSMGVRLPAAAA